MAVFGGAVLVAARAEGVWRLISLHAGRSTCAGFRRALSKFIFGLSREAKSDDATSGALQRLARDREEFGGRCLYPKGSARRQNPKSGFLAERREPVERAHRGPARVTDRVEQLPGAFAGGHRWVIAGVVWILDHVVNENAAAAAQQRSDSAQCDGRVGLVDQHKAPKRGIQPVAAEQRITIELVDIGVDNPHMIQPLARDDRSR